MTDIDHAAEALRLAAIADRAAQAGAEAVAPLAHVYATLALVQAQRATVEQLRIGNLIALANTQHMGENYDDTVEASRAAAYALIHYVQADPDDEYPTIQPDIARALGIDP